MTDEDLINLILFTSSITEELRDWERIELRRGITVHEYMAGSCLFQPGKSIDTNSLNILGSGEAEVFTSHGQDPLKLRVLNQAISQGSLHSQVEISHKSVQQWWQKLTARSCVLIETSLKACSASNPPS